MNGKQLRKQRKARGLTQVQLAKYIGVAPNTVARWERGELPIREPIEKLIQLMLPKESHPSQEK